MIRAFFSNEHGGPAAEFALILPAMIVLMFGGTEAGHFAYTQHKLTKAVREGARYASRLPVEQFCEGVDVSDDFATEIEPNVKSVTVTGGLPPAGGGSAGPPVVPGFTIDQVVVGPPACAAFAPGEDDLGTGIYSALGNGGPIITVTVTGVPYPSLFAGLGSGIGTGVTLSARSSEAVIGL